MALTPDELTPLETTLLGALSVGLPPSKAAGDEYLDRDAVFGVKQSLIAEFTEHTDGTAPDGTTRDGRWAQVEFDLVLAPRPCS